MPKSKKEDRGPPPDDKFQQLDITSKDPRTAVLMLDSPEPSIVCKACNALNDHIKKSEQNCIETQSYNIVPKLVSLLSSTEKPVVASSLICLSSMTHNLGVRRSLLKLSCVLPLLDMLKPEQEVVILERASYVVSQLAEEYLFKQQLEDEGVCPHLIKLLSHSDCDVIKNCIKGLSLLSCYYISRSSIVEENGLPPILSLLDSEYATVQELALQTLQQCLHDISGRKLFKECKGLAKLVEFLNNQEWNDLHVLTVDVLSLCLLEEGGIEVLHTTDCLHRLLESINNSQLPQMKSKATLTLARAASDVTTQKILHDQNAEKVFIQSLSSTDELVLTASCDALRQLASLTSSKQYIGLEGGITSLVHLLKHSIANVRSSAVHTLSCIISETPSNALLVYEANGIEHIVNLLTDELALSRVYSASCIISMSPNDMLRNEVIEHGAMGNLVECMVHIDVNVQQICLEVIALLSIDTSAREQFPIEDVGKLVNLILSINMGVARCAMWALSVLVLNKKISENVFKNRGLETLQQLSKQTSHKEILEYIRLAMKRLLAGCPSAQYYINGYIPYNISLIGSEFYDMSTGDTSKGFVALEDLINDPPILNKPILTVSLINQPPSSSVPAAATDDIDNVSSQLDMSHTTNLLKQHHHQRNSSSSSKSSKKGKSEKAATDLLEETNGIDTAAIDEILPIAAAPTGYLQPDPLLYVHINHVLHNIQPLIVIREQIESLALYVSQVMGGAVRRGTDIQYELLLTDTQANNNTNIVPLGNVQKGSFQHRSLLYKVLADHIGIPCTLHRGDYGRYWNTVLCDKEEWLVDLMYTPGRLLNEGTGDQEASYYKSI